MFIYSMTIVFPLSCLWHLMNLNPIFIPFFKSVFLSINNQSLNLLFILPHKKTGQQQYLVNLIEWNYILQVLF